MFQFIVIDPRKPVVPPNTLGIEVTIPEIAALCDLGNIDFQHGGSHSVVLDGEHVSETCARDAAYAGKAAIEVALTYPLPAVPADPRRCVTLATFRPDLDSFGAMAVLALRARGLLVKGEGHPAWDAQDSLVKCGGLARVRDIAAADGNTATTWVPRPLPTVENPWPRAVAIDSLRDLAPIASIVSDRDRDLRFRVACVATWIMNGYDAIVAEADIAADACGLSVDYESAGPPAGEAILIALIDARRRIEAERADMIAALSDGRIKITCVFNQTDRTAPRERERFRGEGPVLFTTERHVVVERLGSTCYEPNDFAAYAIVRSAHRAATSLGQSVAPLAICFHPSFHWPQGHATPKATVAWAVPPGAEVVARVRDALNAAEREKIATQIDSIDLGVTYEGDFPGVFFDARPGRPAVGAATLLRGGHISEALDVIANMRSADAERFAKDVAVITAAIKSEWGGNLASGILGSPQGRASLLTEDEIVSTVRGAL